MTYRSQLCDCVASGVAEPMTNGLFDLMGGDDKSMAQSIAKFWGVKNFDGIKFCGAKPGVCCLKHCMKVTDDEIASAKKVARGESK